MRVVQRIIVVVCHCLNSYAKQILRDIACLPACRLLCCDAAHCPPLIDIY